MYRTGLAIGRLLSEAAALRRCGQNLRSSETELLDAHVNVAGLRCGQCRALSSTAAGRAESKFSAARLADRGVIAMGGPDALEFLQGLTTNDFRQLRAPKSERNRGSAGGFGGLPPRRAAIHTAFLTPQGRVAFDALAVRRGDGEEGLFLDVPAVALPKIKAHLTQLKLRSQVTIEDATDDLEVWARWCEAVSAPASGDEDTEAASWIPDPRLPALGERGIFARGTDAPAPLQYGNLGTDAYARWRMACGVAEGAEMSGQLPLECNIEALNGVSFEKGCYVGQELTARTNFRGVVRKRVMPVALAAAPGGGGGEAVDGQPQLGTPIVVDGERRAVGKLIAVDGGHAGPGGERLWTGLALLRLGKVLCADGALRVDDAPRLYLEKRPECEVRPQRPPWWRPRWGTAAEEEEDAGR